jgi:4,5-DOPA dioxygenase extradiol
MRIMPAIFFGHGNPMNALQRNSYTERWAQIGSALPRPKAILCVSAHWYVPGAAVTVNTAAHDS